MVHFLLGSGGRRSNRRFVAGASLSLLFAGCSSDSTKGAGDGGASEGGAAAPDSGPGVPDSGPRHADGGDAGGPRFEVTTKSGVVVGKRDGKVRAFYGIPYAAPPTGDNRWRPPRPVMPWTTPRNATAAPKVCPQITAGGTGADARSDEDCLVVNVWMPDPPPSAPLPVMVWIHGGAFAFGSGGETYYDGGRLVEEGKVVVVGMNYRLGALGFLTHPALTAEDKAHPTSGNYGFEDQQAALRWVKDNVAAFGGDAGQVTIFGESAGGYSVCAHLVAPGSAGLFHRAVSESGPCGLISQTRDGQYANSEALARALGCTDSAKVLECLRSKAPADFLNVAAPPMLPGGLFFQSVRAGADAGADGGAGRVPTLWGPVTDGVDILVDVGKLDSHFAKTPLLLGTNLNEGTLFSDPTLFGGIPVKDATEYEAAVARSFGSDTASILKQYPASAFPSPNDALNELTVDAFFTCPNRRLARAAAAAGVDVYLYSFSHAAEKPLVMNLGAFHSSELGYVFGTDFPLAVPQADEQPLGTAIRGYWTRFAYSGDPNGGGSPNWPKYSAKGDENLKLDLPQPTTETGHKKAKCDFWDTLSPP